LRDLSAGIGIGGLGLRIIGLLVGGGDLLMGRLDTGLLHRGLAALGLAQIGLGQHRGMVGLGNRVILAPAGQILLRLGKLLAGMGLFGRQHRACPGGVGRLQLGLGGGDGFTGAIGLARDGRIGHGEGNSGCAERQHSGLEHALSFQAVVLNI
jgi:hypothetical protein